MSNTEQIRETIGTEPNAKTEEVHNALLRFHVSSAQALEAAGYAPFHIGASLVNAGGAVLSTERNLDKQRFAKYLRHLADQLDGDDTAGDVNLPM